MFQSSRVTFRRRRKTKNICKHLDGSTSQGRVLTEVDVVFSTPLAVHLVDEEGGQRFEEEAEDGHAHAEAEQICLLERRVKNCDVDDVDYDRQ